MADEAQMIMQALLQGAPKMRMGAPARARSPQEAMDMQLGPKQVEVDPAYWRNILRIRALSRAIFGDDTGLRRLRQENWEARRK